MRSIEQQTRDAVIIVLIFAAMCIALSSLSGCGGTGAAGQAGASGMNGTNAVPSTAPTDTVASIVNDYNAWRTDNGQETINPGLTCTLYTVPQTTTAIIGAVSLVNQGSFTYVGVFDQPNANVNAGLNILPTAMQEVYQTWFIVKCTGYIVVPTDDYHEFDVTSDDGSNLYVDGALVVNDDGLHGAQTVTGERHLQDTVHTFEIDFFQSNGSQELVVNMDSALLPSANLYH